MTVKCLLVHSIIVYIRWHAAIINTGNLRIPVKVEIPEIIWYKEAVCAGHVLIRAFFQTAPA